MVLILNIDVGGWIFYITYFIYLVLLCRNLIWFHLNIEVLKFFFLHFFLFFCKRQFTHANNKNIKIWGGVYCITKWCEDLINRRVSSSQLLEASRQHAGLRFTYILTACLLFQAEILWMMYLRIILANACHECCSSSPAGCMVYLRFNFLITQ